MASCLLVSIFDKLTNCIYENFNTRNIIIIINRLLILMPIVSLRWIFITISRNMALPPRLNMGEIITTIILIFY